MKLKIDSENIISVPFIARDLKKWEDIKSKKHLYLLVTEETRDLKTSSILEEKFLGFTEYLNLTKQFIIQNIHSKKKVSLNFYNFQEEKKGNYKIKTLVQSKVIAEFLHD